MISRVSAEGFGLFWLVCIDGSKITPSVTKLR